MASLVVEEPKPAFDQERAERFEETFVTVLNYAALALMTSLGHRTGLFDAMAEAPPLPWRPRPASSS